jgi:hypothetical protein
VDFTHPALGDCFGGDCKVGWDYDFVGDNFDDYHNARPKDKPTNTCNGHGTHLPVLLQEKHLTLPICTANATWRLSYYGL